MAGKVSFPARSRARRRATPVVVSSVTPSRRGTSSGRWSTIRPVSSAPSAIRERAAASTAIPESLRAYALRRREAPPPRLGRGLPLRGREEVLERHVEEGGPRLREILVAVGQASAHVDPPAASPLELGPQ